MVNPTIRHRYSAANLTGDVIGVIPMFERLEPCFRKMQEMEAMGADGDIGNDNHFHRSIVDANLSRP